MPFSIFDEISRTKDARVDAIGFTLHLRAADLAALQTFVAVVRAGVAVR